MFSDGSESGSPGVTDELRKVCAELLNDADVCVSLGDENDTVVLTFMPASQECEIVFQCRGLQILRLAKHPEDTCGFFVGETHVEMYSSASDIRRLTSEYWEYPDDQLPKRLYSVRTLPGAVIDILCTNFSWDRRPINP